MDYTMENGYKIKEVIAHIDKCQEERQRNPMRDIEAPGLGWNGCSYYKILQEEKQKLKPKQDTPMQILIQQQFLKDQGKFKKAEQKWFDKLESELERMEMDEAIINYRKQRKMLKSQDESPLRPKAIDVIGKESTIGNELSMSKDYQEIQYEEEESSEVTNKSNNYNLDTVKHCMDKISLITRI